MKSTCSYRRRHLGIIRTSYWALWRKRRSQESAWSRCYSVWGSMPCKYRQNKDGASYSRSFQSTSSISLSSKAWNSSCKWSTWKTTVLSTPSVPSLRHCQHSLRNPVCHAQRAEQTRSPSPREGDRHPIGVSRWFSDSEVPNCSSSEDERPKQP